MLEEMENREIIEPSTVAWLSLLVLVSKPGGCQGMCLDHRQMNTRLETELHPSPKLKEMIERTSGQKYCRS